jgi:hypothetical protein
MSMSWCEGCEKRIDTDFVEFQQNGSLCCDNCLDEMELEPVAETATRPADISVVTAEGLAQIKAAFGPDWKALAGELAAAVAHLRFCRICAEDGEDCCEDGGRQAIAALAKYNEQEVRA